MSTKSKTKSELFVELNELREFASSYKETMKNLQLENEKLEYRLKTMTHSHDEAQRQLKNALAENVFLKQEITTALDKVEKLYSTLMERGEAVLERKFVADYWYRKSLEYQSTILERGRVRMKYDLPYAVWRDNTMERVATNRSGEPIDMDELAKRLGRACHGQLPNGSNDFYTAMLHMAEEFGFVVENRKAIPKELKEKELKEKRQLQMSENFRKVYSDAAQEVIQELSEKANKEMVEAEDKRMSEELKNLNKPR